MSASEFQTRSTPPPSLFTRLGLVIFTQHCFRSGTKPGVATKDYCKDVHTLSLRSQLLAVSPGRPSFLNKNTPIKRSLCNVLGFAQTGDAGLSLACSKSQFSSYYSQLFSVSLSNKTSISTSNFQEH